MVMAGVWPPNDGESGGGLNSDDGGRGSVAAVGGVWWRLGFVNLSNWEFLIFVLFLWWI